LAPPTFFRIKYAGLVNVIGRENFFMESALNPVASTAKAIQRARILIGDAKANVSLYVASERSETSILK